MALRSVEIFDDAAEKVTDTSECRAFLSNVAKAAASAAQASAPVRTGQYRASIFGDVLGGDKPMAQIASSSSFWHMVEYGTIHNAPHRTLTNAAQAACARYEAL